jgi:hypothetical protein
VERRNILAVVTVILAIVVVGIAFTALGGREPGASASPSPSPSADPSPTVEASPSASASVAPSESASPSAAAGPLEIAWEPAELDPEADVNGVSFVGGRWLVVGQVYPEAAIWTSDDGRSWSRAEIASTREENEVTTVTHVVELDGLLVAIGAFGAMQSDQYAWMTWTSDDDGATWTERRDGPSPHALRAIVPAGPGLVAAGADYTGTTPFDSWIAVSEDGLTWERTSAVFGSTEIISMAVREDRIVAAGIEFTDGGAAPSVFFSDDGGASWSAASIAKPSGTGAAFLYEVVATDDGFMAAGGGLGGASAWLSADGESWEQIQIAASAQARGLALVDGGFVAVGNVVGHDIGPGHSWTSVDARTWEDGTEFSPGTVMILAADGDGSTVVAGGQCVIVSESCEAVLWVGEVTR